MVFTVALLHKVRAWPRFNASMAAYRLIPDALVGPAAGLLIAAEALTVVLLVVSHWLAGASAALLLSLYALAIVVSVLRGRTHIDCGCGDEPTPVSWTLVLRNVCLIGLAVFSAQLQAAGALDSGAAWLAGAVSLALALVGFGIYQAVEQLFANRGRHQRLWLGAS
jgi:hypothetical protein